jgi:hypothetical protein
VCHRGHGLGKSGFLVKLLRRRLCRAAWAIMAFRVFVSKSIPLLTLSPDETFSRKLGAFGVDVVSPAAAERVRPVDVDFHPVKSVSPFASVTLLGPVLQFHIMTPAPTTPTTRSMPTTMIKTSTATMTTTRKATTPTTVSSQKQDHATTSCNNKPQKVGPSTTSPQDVFVHGWTIHRGIDFTSRGCPNHHGRRVCQEQTQSGFGPRS